VTLRLYIHKPKVIMRARLNMTDVTTYPLDILNFDSVTLGNVTLLKETMTLLLGSGPDKDDYGMVRYRYMDPDFPTTQMHVSRYSQGTGIGELDRHDNAYITVLEDYRVWAKIPYFAGGAMWKDYDIGSYLNNGKPPGVPNGGPGTAGTIDPGTGRLEVAFDAQSWIADKAISPAISVPQNHIWEFPGTATIVAGSTASRQVTVRFLPGFYYVYLTVHNWGLNHAETQKIPIFARDPANDLSITKFQVVSHSQDSIGQELVIDLPSNLPRTTYYDGFLIMMWEDDIPYVPLLRRHMQFIGWHQADAVALKTELTATLDDTRLTFYDAGKRLTMLPGFTIVMEYKAVVGTDWAESEFANILYYIWFLLHYHTTVLEIADFHDYTHSLAAFEFTVLGSDKQNVSAQIQELAARVSPDYRMTCNRQGQLKMIPDLSLMLPTNRPSTTMDTIYDNMWTNITWSYSHQPKVGQIQTKSLISSHGYIMIDDIETLEVIACVAASSQHGQGEQLVETGEMIAFNATDLRNTEGNRFAKLNRLYEPFTITVPYEILDPDVDVGEAKWVQLNLEDDYHPIREATGFSLLRGVITEMGIQYDYTDTGFYRTVTLKWEMETVGLPAVEVILWPDDPSEGI
jgi:hypothetical protein